MPGVGFSIFFCILLATVCCSFCASNPHDGLHYFFLFFHLRFFFTVVLYASRGAVKHWGRRGMLALSNFIFVSDELLFFISLIFSLFHAHPQTSLVSTKWRENAHVFFCIYAALLYSPSRIFIATLSTKLHSFVASSSSLPDRATLRISLRIEYYLYTKSLFCIRKRDFYFRYIPLLQPHRLFFLPRAFKTGAVLLSSTSLLFFFDKHNCSGLNFFFPSACISMHLCTHRQIFPAVSVLLHSA